MDIAFAFDEGYADHAQVAIESILDTHPSGVTFWLLTTPEVAAARAEGLYQQIRGRGEVELVPVDPEFRSLPGSRHERCQYISTGMYLRLFLSDLLPQRVGRVLYLDSDVLVNGDLSPLWELPLGEAPLAAVRDGLARSMGYEGGIPGAGSNVRADAPYFNSGVMMMNLPVWRRLNVTERCVEYLIEYQDQLRFPDQDALNLVCYEQWVRLKSIWNDTFLWWLKADDHEAVRRSVRITHFLGPNKPWQDGFPFTGYRDRYRELAARVPGLPVPGSRSAESAMSPEPDRMRGPDAAVDRRRIHTLLPPAPWLLPDARDGR